MYLSKVIGYSIWIAPAYVCGDVTLPSKVIKLSAICEQYECSQCGGKHDKVWWYRPTKARPLGHFMAVRIGSDWHVPDSSLPHSVEHIVKTEIELPANIASALWHDKSGSHEFTGGQYPLVKQFLVEAGVKV